MSLCKGMHSRLIDVEFKDGTFYLHNFHNKQKHKPKIKFFFQNLFRDREIDFEGSIKFMEEEHCYIEGTNGFGHVVPKDTLNDVTIFSWSISGISSSLPDSVKLLPAYNILLQKESQKKDIFSLDQNETPYRGKIDKCVYRYGICIPERLKLVELSRKNPEIMDCKYKYSDEYLDMVMNCEPGKRRTLKNWLKRKKAANYMCVSEMLKYKVQVEMYGWESFLWKLKSNCLVLKWKTMNEHTMLDNFFKPDVHYILVDENDIVDKITFYMKEENHHLVEDMIESRKKVFNETLSNEAIFREYGINAIKEFLTK